MKVSSVHSEAIVPASRSSAASVSIVWMTWPVLIPGSEAPLIAAAGYML